MALIIPVKDWGEWIVKRVLIGRLHPPNKFPAVVKPPTGLCKQFEVVAEDLRTKT